MGIEIIVENTVFPENTRYILSGAELDVYIYLRAAPNNLIGGIDVVEEAYFRAGRKDAADLTPLYRLLDANIVLANFRGAGTGPAQYLYAFSINPALRHSVFCSAQIEWAQPNSKSWTYAVQEGE